ncbi:MAG: hypothetical protein R2851_14645 [Caldilineaceae bacterium]
MLLKLSMSAVRANQGTLLGALSPSSENAVSGGMTTGVAPKPAPISLSRSIRSWSQRRVG